MVRIGDIRSGLRRGREERRRLLTRGERVFAWSYTIIASLLAPVGILLLVMGGDAAHPVGIALLLVALFVMAVPISPFLRARVHKREGEADQRT